MTETSESRHDAAVMTLLKTLLILPFFLCFAEAAEKICPTIEVHGGHSLKFSDDEKELMCGSEKDEAYKVVPLYQAQFELTGFLQARGYLNPSFTIEGNVLRADVGKKGHVKKIDVDADGDPHEALVKKELHHRFKGQLLNPAVLTKMEGQAKDEFRERGFPCVKIAGAADVLTNTVRFKATGLSPFLFGPNDREKIPGLLPEALDRFYPFTENDSFNGKLLKLTEKRMLRAEVVQGTYFVEDCSKAPSSFSLGQKFIAGEPRTLRFGAGASTEQGPMARAKWANNRQGSMASHASVTLQASARVQSLTLLSDRYLWKNKPRRSLFTQFDLTRESQFEYEQSLIHLRPHVKWTRDGKGKGWTWQLGPGYEGGTFHSKVNSNTRSYANGIIEGAVAWMDHDYEFFDVNPEEGGQFGFNFDYRSPVLNAANELLKLDSTYAALTRMGNWDRGSLVGGLRINLGTTWVKDSVSASDLPPAVKFFGGGSDDIRGYLLKTLPKNGGAGALTRATLKLELRRTYLLIESLEGFAFVDNGFFGERSWNLQPRLWYTPGVGLRWMSPIGLVQTYVARALTVSPTADYRNFYFIGLGGTF